MNREHMLAILYEMALLTASESNTEALLRKFLQRLLYHSAFPCGMFLSEIQDSGDAISSAKIELAICNREISRHVSQTVQFPQALVTGTARLSEDSALVQQAFPDSRYRVSLNLPVPGSGTFLLLSTTLPDHKLPLTTLFEPVLANFSKTLQLVRSNELFTARLQQESAEHKRLAEALEKSKRLLTSVLDNIPARVFWKDANSVYLGCNRAFARDAGMDSPAQVIGRTDYHLPWVEQAENYRADDRAVMQSGQPKLNYEQRQTRPDGSVNWLEASKIPLIGLDGKVIGVLGTYQDITLRKTHEKAIIKAKEEAEKANGAKSEFLSRMSHELRTPMNAILGFSQVLESDKVEPLTNMQREHVEEILKAGFHLLDLINEVLDLAKVESGKIDLSVESVDFTEVLGECLALLQPQAEKRHINIQNVSANCPLRHVYADRTRLKQVLLNLLSNAIKYNQEYGGIAITCQPAPGNYLRAAVTDSGIGMTAEQLANLFEPFNRLGVEETEIEGTGIGLVITKKLIELMHGRIEAASTPGMGTTFQIEIPGAASPLFEATTSAIQNDAPPQSPVKLDGCHKILCIEDNPANLLVLKHMLARYPNLTMIEARHPELGLALARSEQPALILMDINLPGMDGYEALSHLQAMDETLHIPVVAISANAMPKDIQKGNAAGFSRYLTKPIRLTDINKALADFLPASEKP